MESSCKDKVSLENIIFFKETRCEEKEEQSLERRKETQISKEREWRTAI